MSALVSGQLAAARAHGLPVDQLAAVSGLREDDLRDPDGRVPTDSWIALWEAIDARPEAREFGIALARAVTVQTLGVVGYAMQHAPDVRAAFGCLTRFRKLIGDSASPEIDERDDRVLFHKVEPPRLARLSGLSLSVPLGTLTLLHELIGLPSHASLALEATFQHPPPSDAARFSEELRCPVQFNAPETSLAVQRSVFDRPLRRPDPSLYAYLERHARALESQLRDTQGIAERVRQCLVERLRDGEPEQREIARLLGLHERTLQRRLRAEQTSFAQLLDDVRSELARMYLSDAQLAVFEVAYLLGFSEPSAFNRAFRRWTGTSPRDYRRGL
ncbi:MAG TPA: AraC family transcriptional regulator ligand-binding domain-containing protein [Polyangiales bacterium]|nr:AraC family transcriptional regulator ligand-binding domain-containing protein [Polyangiales bacterium]